jgi:hypothetical protein
VSGEAPPALGCGAGAKGAASSLATTSLPLRTGAPLRITGADDPDVCADAELAADALADRALADGALEAAGTSTTGGGALTAGTGSGGAVGCGARATVIEGTGAGTTSARAAA